MKKQTGIINLTTLTRLARRVYGAKAKAEVSAWDGCGIFIASDPDNYTMLVDHPDHAVARRMVKAALEEAVRANAPKKRARVR